MGRYTGPTMDKIPTLPIETADDAVGASQVVANMRNVVVQFDGDGGTAVTGAVQLQGSIGGVEYVDIGSEISTWPSILEVAQYFTHLRVKTTTTISAGTPVARIGGFYD